MEKEWLCPGQARDMKLMRHFVDKLAPFAFLSFSILFLSLYFLTVKAILCSTVILASTAASATATIIHSGRKIPAAIPA